MKINQSFFEIPEYWIGTRIMKLRDLRKVDSISFVFEARVIKNLGLSTF